MIQNTLIIFFMEMFFQGNCLTNNKKAVYVKLHLKF